MRPRFIHIRQIDTIQNLTNEREDERKKGTKQNKEKELKNRRRILLFINVYFYRSTDGEIRF